MAKQMASKRKANGKAKQDAKQEAKAMENVRNGDVHKEQRDETRDNRFFHLSPYSFSAFNFSPHLDFQEEKSIRRPLTLTCILIPSF
jgi:hypothetical protein